MHLKKMICVGAVAVGALASTGVATASASTVSEAGSSLVYPVASVWASHYNGAVVNTAAGGSGKGIQLVTAGQVDIGASDAPMTSGQYNTGNADYVQIPWALSATGVGYNLPGVGSGLKLSGPVLAGIYTGRISNWGSSAITRLNSARVDRALRRDGRITPVFRSDGSGDSYAFQHFLTLAGGGVWKNGYSTTFASTTGNGENGNAGVAGEVKSVRGAIGYISGAYLLQQRLSVAAVGNAAGQYELPDPANILEAAKSNTRISGQGPGFTGLSIVAPSRRYRTAYPISTFTYAIVSKKDSNLGATEGFLRWVISSNGGQQYGYSLDFPGLPSAVRGIDAGLINSL